MKLDQGITKVYTWSGFASTLALVLIIGAYAAQKMAVLVNNSDVDVFETELISYFDDTYSFGADGRFNLAVAFTAFDDVEEPILDPTIGELTFKAFEWGAEDGTPVVKQDKIESQHRCTRAELGLADDENAKFF